MAHEIHTRDNLFTVREAAWHGLGEVLPEHPTRSEAKAIAHPWEPITEPLYRQVPSFDVHGYPTSRFEEVETHRANVRSDDGHMLGITSDTYEVVSNEEMYDIAEAIEGESKGSVKFETGGSLKGGSKVWLLIRLAEPIMIGDDPLTATIPYYALQNSHDGSGAFRGQATMTRIVCDNTAQMSDLDATQRGTQFAFSHTKNVKGRIEEAQIALAGWRESITNYQLMSEALLGMEVSQPAAMEFIERFIPAPLPGTASDRVQDNVRKAQMSLHEILYSETCEAISGTAYGLVQASVEYLNHSRKAHTQESRFKRAYLDKSAILPHAVELAQTAAGN